MDCTQKISLSEVDIRVQLVHMHENLLKAVDFIYPYKVNDNTFVTSEIPQYLWDANLENLRIIPKGMLQNDARFSFLFRDFNLGNKSTSLAFSLKTRVLESFVGKFFLFQKTMFSKICVQW